ncbi:hypothetical protein CS022_21250 [Veronia nyctiphanis]|uniref:Error-prone DNA polymerase n=1 Tax=Veronia nyctiphanis TaxID=1278244 RepID=A0A4Q0YLU1_9GAMM|nr:hypothetical protein CS022_21250 [Veronia nyctiphanis]
MTFRFLFFFWPNKLRPFFVFFLLLTELTIAHETSLSSSSKRARAGDDVNVFRQLQKGDSVGVFQIESRAQMNMLPRMKPESYYDLVIQIAIVRPGPIQGDMVHPYLRRRWGKEPVRYPSDEVAAVLSRTFGVPIFQEQVIQLAMVAAGFSGGEADQLRRAMAAWKRHGKLTSFRDKLVSGMAERGYSDAFANRLFRQIQGFGEYGFPESHSASFALLAYVSAWLKTYYPAEFYCGLLNSQPMGFYSPSQLLLDAQRHNVECLPVCINSSAQENTCHRSNKGTAIRLGLCIIKGLNQETIKTILSHRPDGGYISVHQLKVLGVSHQQLEALASANALHKISGDRFNARWEIMDNSETLSILTESNSSISTGRCKITPSSLIAPTEIEDTLEDYNATGLTLNKHPIALLDEAHKLGKHILAKDLRHCRHGSVVAVAGLVTGRQRPGTASGVTFITLEDHTGNINVVVWLNTAREQAKPFISAKILKVKGIIEKEGDVIHVVAGRLIDLTQSLNEYCLQQKSALPFR